MGNVTPIDALHSVEKCRGHRDSSLRDAIGDHVVGKATVITVPANIDAATVVETSRSADSSIFNVDGTFVID